VPKPIAQGQLRLLADKTRGISPKGKRNPLLDSASITLYGEEMFAVFTKAANKYPRGEKWDRTDR
jgi:hypothetical protein